MNTTTTVSSPLLRHCIGLDIANKSFSSALGRERRDFVPDLALLGEYANEVSGYERLIESIREEGLDPSACLYVMEATGVYYEALAHWLHEHNYRVVVLLPNQVLAFAKSLNIKTKSDSVDASTLAHMGCERYLEPWRPAPAELKALKQLTRLRQRLLHQRSQNKNQLHAAQKEVPASEAVIRILKETIAFLTQQVQELETQIQALIQSHKELDQAYQRITTIPGMRLITAATLIAETQNFRLFRNQAQLVSYAGYDVVKRQSGSSIRHQEKISKKGNHHIRKALYFPAITASRYIPAFKRLYQRVNQKNPQTKMKGAVALQRKLLVLAFRLVKTEQEYDPQKMT